MWYHGSKNVYLDYYVVAMIVAAVVGCFDAVSYVKDLVVTETVVGGQKN